jgi:hypothetical protein
VKIDLDVRELMIITKTQFIVRVNKAKEKLLELKHYHYSRLPGKGGLAMSGNEKRTKPKYEAPTVVPLGGLARGTGYCAAGSSPSEGYCTAGIAAPSACTDGSGAVGAACTGGSLPGAP